MALTLSNIKEIFDPEVQKYIMPRHGFITELLFGGASRKIDGMTLGWDEITKYATVAPLYGLQTAAVEQVKRGGTQKEVNLAFYKSKHALMNSEGMARVLGTTQFDGRSQADNLASAMMDLLKDQYEEIARRKDLLCISAGFNSYIDLIGYGVDQRVTFTRPASLDITLLGADQWLLNGTVDIPRQFNNWKLLFQKEAKTGVLSGVVMNSTTAEKFITNAEIKKLRNRSDNWTQGIVGIDDTMLESMGVQFLGVVENIRVYSFDYWYEEDVGGVMTAKNGIPDNELMFFSRSAVTAKNQIIAGTPPMQAMIDSPIFQGLANYKKIQNPVTNNLSVMGIRGENPDVMSLQFISASAETPIMKQASTMRVRVA